MSNFRTKTAKIDSNSELIISLQKGSELALVEIYNLYWHKLLLITYNYTKDRRISQKIIEDIFTELWDGRKEVKIESLTHYFAGAVMRAMLGYKLENYKFDAAKDIVSQNNLLVLH